MRQGALPPSNLLVLCAALSLAVALPGSPRSAPALRRGWHLQAAAPSAIPRQLLVLRGGEASNEEGSDGDGPAAVEDGAAACGLGLGRGALEEVPERLSFPDTEERILEYWDEIDAFRTSLAQARAEGRERWVFYDGPPFATGLPHYGHILAGTIKDVVTRFWAQNGKLVERRWGWDCHGLPIEYEIEQALGVKGRADVEAMGIPAFNAECRAVVMRYAGEWKRVVRRLARWVDMEDDYRTMDAKYMESVWWVFKTLFDKGFVYKGFKVMPYSTACTTALSNFEANLNYKDVSDPAVIVAFPLIDDPGLSVLAWTTTPWTLPSNLALCANPSFTYAEIRDIASGKRYLILAARLSQLYPKDASKHYEFLGNHTAASLANRRYSPIFPFLAPSFHPGAEGEGGAFRIVLDDYVGADAGTGFVHMAPGFGEDDYRVCVAQKVVGKEDPRTCPVDKEGRFTEVIGEGLAGRRVKECDKDIIKLVKEAGRLVQSKTVMHSYPFCWRSETPLIYRTVPSWFVDVERIKDRLLANNAQTEWIPAFVKEKRFHNWLAGARDWAVSRDRFWGTPLPIWSSEDGEEVVCIGSVEELFLKSGVNVTDLHRESIDHIEIPSNREGNPPLRRIPEVFDCWFESGSMPYAQLHYPFENKEEFEKSFPGDFIAEGLDQTRGWFYTLMVLSTALFDKPAFKNVIVNGLVLASDGKKMSKRLKNYPDPELVINKHGADALRVYLISSPVVRAEPLKFAEEGVREVVRDLLLPWYNAYRFLVQQSLRLKRAAAPGPGAEEQGAAEEEGQGAAPQEEEEGAALGEFVASENPMDLWIQAAAAGLVEFVTEEMKAFRLSTVMPRLLRFVDDLTNWYLRMNRARIKGSNGAAEAKTSQAVLLQAIGVLTRVMAPFTPLLSEYIFLSLRPLLRKDFRAASVHFLPFPVPAEGASSPGLEEKVARMQAVIVAGRAARDRRQVSLRTPLALATVVLPDQSLVDDLSAMESYILQELNLRAIVFTTQDHPATVLSALPDAPILGKRLGGKYSQVAAALKALPEEDLRLLLKDGSITLCGELITSDEVKVSRGFGGAEGGSALEAVALEGVPGAILVLDATVDAAAESEAIAREIINRVQRLKKTSGILPADGPSTSIALRVASCPGAPALLDALSLHSATLLAPALGRVPLLVPAGGAWGDEGVELAVAEEVIVVGGESVVVEIRVVKLSAPLGESVADK